jgi:hypothetical protein
MFRLICGSGGQELRDGIHGMENKLHVFFFVWGEHKLSALLPHALLLSAVMGALGPPVGEPKPLISR